MVYYMVKLYGRVNWLYGHMSSLCVLKLETHTNN